MAEVSVDIGPTVNNFGNQTGVSARVDVAATGDTWTHGLRDVTQIVCPPRTNLTDVALNEAGDKVVFTTGGAVTNILVTVIGSP